MKSNALTAFLLATCILSAPSAAAQSAENVAVLINEKSAASQQIGEYYVRTRAIPAVNVIRLRTSTEDTIERKEYLATMERPISAAIAKAGLQDRILYLVLTKGIPLRIAGTSGIDGTLSSVDSELTLLYRRMTGRPTPVQGRLENPYFLGTRRVQETKPFTHREHDIYLVTRLDAFTVDEALALIDRAQKPSSDGQIVLDQKAGLVDRGGDAWLETAAERLRELGHGARVVLESTAAGARNVKPVIGFYSWGSNDPANRARMLNMGFVPGAIAATFVSSDGRTFQNPPPDWTPSSSTDKKTWFGGSPQSLVGDLIREGATGVAGHVAEPYLQSAVRPEILFPAYLSGLTLAEAFYLAIPHLSWQTVVVGDPLCTPFPRKALSRSDIEDAIDLATELPGFFAKRRIEQAKALLPKGPPEVITFSLKAEVRLTRGDVAGARAALEEATALEPRVVGMQLQLGSLYDQAGQYDAAIARYRKVLEVQPDNLAALNNLAYDLAERKKAFAEAKPFADKALSLAPNDPNILDTAGWIAYLLGEHAMAEKLLSTAAKGAPRNAEVRLHAAFAHAASGAVTVAAAELKAALELDPSLAQRDDVKKLRARLLQGV